MKSFNSLILLAIFISIHSLLYANNYGFDETTLIKHINTKDGLSNMRVFSIEKDKHGKMWLSTRSGIDSYDGTNFRHYNLNQTTIIPDEDGRVYNLYSDYGGRIWCYTNSGKILYYDSWSDSFKHFLSIWDILNDNNIQTNGIHITADSTCWVCLRTGILEINLNDKNDYKVYNLQTSANNIIPFKDTFLVLTDDGIYEYSDNDFQCLIPNVRAISGYYDMIKEYLWIGTFAHGLKLYYYAHEFKELQHNWDAPKLPIKSLEKLNNNLLCAGIDGGGVTLIDMTLRNKVGQLSEHNSSSLGGLCSDGVYDLYIDKGRYIWIATYTGGVTLVDALKNQFKLDKLRNRPDYFTHNNHINALLEDNDGDMWYATNQGIAVYIKKKNEWKYFLEEEGVFLSLCKSIDNDYVWAGGFGAGLILIDKNKGIIERHKVEDQVGLTTNYIYSIYNDRNGALWIGGSYGNLVEIKLPISDNKNKTYNAEYVNWIGENKSGNIAIATVNGIGIVDNNKELNWYAKSNVNNISNYNSFIYCCYFESDSIVWLGTDGAGLCKYNFNNNTITTYSKSEGLPSNYVYSIQPDRYDLLWITTDQGLFSFNTNNENITVYTVNDGLFLNRFNFNSNIRLKNGDLCFGTSEGIVTFNPVNVSKNLPDKGLELTEFKLSYQTIFPNYSKSPLKKHINETENIVLKHYQNTFSIHFNAIDYWGVKLYRYRLQNYDKEWIETDYLNAAQYTNVAPGKYVFDLELLSEDKKQIIQRKTISINIETPYWFRWWAWMIYIFFVCFIIYKAWKLRIERIKNKYSEEKIDFFIHAAHELRTPVTLIKAPLEELKKQDLSSDGRNALETALKGSERLFQMVGQFLDLQQADLQATKLELQSILVKEFVTERLITFKSWCKQKSISLNLYFPENEQLFNFDPLLIGKVIDNLVSNAIKYTQENGQIDIFLSYDDIGLTLEVKDNGIGIPKSAQSSIFKHFFRASNAFNSKSYGNGIGLMLSKKYISLHNGTLTFVSTEGEGSSFTMSLPFIAITSARTENKEISTDEIKTIENNSNFHKRVLYIEDNADLRSYMKRILNQSFKVIDFENAEDAVCYLNKESVDIIISDIMLPGMQGDKFCVWVKSNMATSHIPVILLTAKTSKNDLLDGFKCGADDYLSKPFDVDILITRIYNMLENRKRLKYKFENIVFSTIPIEKDETSNMNIEEIFLSNLNSHISKNIGNVDYQIDELCKDMAMSRSLFYNKLKALTGESPSEFIRTKRIKYAQSLLEKGIYTVREVSEMAGFNDVKNFSTLFKKETGITPGKIVPIKNK